jgi:hypothetical protein
MLDWIADYRVVRSLDDPLRPGTRYLAAPPDRLGLRTPQVVIEIGPGEPADLLPDLSRWASAAARAHDEAGWSGLAVPLEVGPLEVGPLDQASTPAPQLWLSRLVEVDERQVADPLTVVAGAALGLAALHAAGGVHGAISAGRMLTTAAGGVLDLPPLIGPAVPGLLARVRDPGQLDALAPELARGEVPTAASDVWALGACLHLALTGRRVRPGMENAVLLTAVQRAAFEPAEVAASQFRAGVLLTGVPAGDVARMIADCCNFDPGDRPTAGTVAAALAQRP